MINVATEYFIARDVVGNVGGVCRFCPTTSPYMLSDVFCSEELPCSHKVHEASQVDRQGYALTLAGWRARTTIATAGTNKKIEPGTHMIAPATI
jgi:N-acyl-L-homoserine lactone synthetase